jgi:hypothetical protein
MACHVTQEREFELRVEYVDDVEEEGWKEEEDEETKVMGKEEEGKEKEGKEE